MKMSAIYLIVLCTICNFLNAEMEMDLWKAECYDENSRLQETLANNFLKLLQKQFWLQANALLLDVGCGNGRITSTLLDHYPGVQILGIDLSADMIQFAKQHFSSPQILFCVDRAEELKTVFPESIDAITSFSCLHWVLDQGRAFQRMYDVLKPGGWAGLMFAAETGFDDPIDSAYAQAIQEEPWRSYFISPIKQVNWNLAQPSDVKKQLNEIGFEVVFMDVQNFDYFFKDISSFRNWVLGCFQQLKLLPEELQIRCAQRIVDLYLQKTCDRQPLDDQCIYQVDAFMVMAIKQN